MRDTEHRKALLCARIEAHRTVAGLELRLARASFDPLGSLLLLFGLDRTLARAAGSVLRAALAELGHRGGDQETPDPEGGAEAAGRS